MESVRQLLPLLLQGSLFLMVMAIAMECRWADFVALKHRPAALLRAVIAVNVIVPVVAVIIVLLFPLEPMVAAGLVLMAVSPLAPLVPGKALAVGGDRAAILRLYVILMVLAIVLVPLSIVLIDRVFGTQIVAPVPVLTRLVLISVLIPVALGLAFAALAPHLAAKGARVVDLLAKIILAVLVVLILWVAGGKLLELVGNGTLLAFTAVTLSGIVAGHLLGGPEWSSRGALALAAAIRHPGMAAALISANSIDRGALAAALLFLLNGVIVTGLYQAWFRRNRPEPAAT